MRGFSRIFCFKNDKVNDDKLYKLQAIKKNFHQNNLFDLNSMSNLL